MTAELLPFLEHLRSRSLRLNKLLQSIKESNRTPNVDKYQCLLNDISLQVLNILHVFWRVKDALHNAIGQSMTGLPKNEEAEGTLLSCLESVGNYELDSGSLKETFIQLSKGLDTLVSEWSQCQFQEPGTSSNLYPKEHYWESSFLPA